MKRKVILSVLYLFAKYRFCEKIRLRGQEIIIFYDIGWYSLYFYRYLQIHSTP